MEGFGCLRLEPSALRGQEMILERWPPTQAATPITLSSGAFSIGTVDSLTGITGAGSRVILQSNASGTAIDLGTKSGWSFTDSELDLVTASILQIGRSNAGQITVSAAMTLPSTVPILDLETAAGGG